MEDSFRHKGLRKKLVEELENKGIKDSNVLESINMIPRHLFLDNAFINLLTKIRLFRLIGSNYFTALHSSFSDTIIKYKTL